MEDGCLLHEGVISKITAAGLVCNITDLGIYGFVPAELMRGGMFNRTRNKQMMRADRSHASYKTGDFIYLKLDSVDLVRGTAIFRPAI